MSDGTNRGIEASRQPAEEAIPALLDAHGGALFGLGLRLCGNPQDAEDMVQETFLNAYRHWEQFEGRAAAKTWLFRIASRVCTRMHRPRSGEPKPGQIEPFDELLPSASRGIPDPEALEGSPFQGFLRREAQDRVGDALADLPPDFRMPLILKDILGLSIQEVAEVLEIKPATVKTRLHRARLKLRQRLVADLPERDAPRPAYSNQVCLDILQLKLEALDKGAPFPVPDAEISERCRSLCQTLDMTHQVCQRIGEAPLPAPFRESLLAEMSAAAS